MQSAPGHKLLLGCLCLSLVFPIQASASQNIEGRIIWPDDVTRAAQIRLVLNLESGKKLYGWPKADGAFVLHGVPEGSHLLDVNAIGLIYPQVRLDVNSVYPGGALVSLAEQRTKIIPPPLVLQPSGLAEYFEKHEPFNLISFVKTPYGLMAAFGIFAIVVLPRLKMDPEELKEARESLAGRGSDTQAIRQRS